MIQLPNPIISPATTYDSAWLKTLQINAPGPNDKTILIASLVPMSSTTGEMAFDTEVQLVIDDLLTLAQSDMSLATACNAVFDAITKQCKLRNII